MRGRLLANVNFFLVGITLLAADTVGNGEETGPPKRTTWNVYKIANKAVWLGSIEAPDEATAMEKAAAEFKVTANRLMAIRRG